MIKKTVCLVMILLIMPVTLLAAARSLDEKPRVKALTVRFNGDYLKALYLYLDARTPEEKIEDEKNKRLKGPVIVFFHGHSQRPGDGYNFTRELALRSRSGIVIVPVCDTPFGRDGKLRGDEGKDVILMEIVRRLLEKNDISIEGYAPDAVMPVIIDSCTKKKEGQDMTAAKLAVVGWSHGALLARRMAGRYPEAIPALGQMAPAGYREWGGYSCVAPGCLLASFSWEGMRVGTGIFRGEGDHIWDSSSGIIKGQAGDNFRSCSSCISGNFHVGKAFRAYRDLQECTRYATDADRPVGGVRSIVVIFGDNDSLFRYDKLAGVKNPGNVTTEEQEAFFSRFYPGSVKAGARCRLLVLPGNHIGPLVHNEKWVEAVLDGIDRNGNTGEAAEK